MPLGPHNTKTFHRTLYSGILQTVTVLKRNPDQQQGTIRAVRLFECRWSKTFQAGEPVAGIVASEDHRVLHIPRIELDRAGIEYFQADDRFVDQEGLTWQLESTNTVTTKLFLNHMCVAVRRVVSG